jgi:ligand-binding SRPBCC domain-containing protein
VHAVQGPYRSWWHEHVFRADGRSTVMEDHVYYALGFGWVGRLVHRLFVASALRRIFAYRGGAVRLRFGLSP